LDEHAGLAEHPLNERVKAAAAKKEINRAGNQSDDTNCANEAWKATLRRREDEKQT
jgi:hypothetical protein